MKIIKSVQNSSSVILQNL